MKKLLLVLGIVCLLSGFGFSQSTTLDDFASAVTGWVVGVGYPTISHEAIDGGNSTAGCMQINDGGWSCSVSKTYTAVVTADGDYKVTFYYKNGPLNNAIGYTGGTASCFLRATCGLSQGQVNMQRVKMSNWEALETPFLYGLTAGSNVLIEVVGNTGASAAVDLRVDEIMLEKATPPVVVEANPPSGYIVSGIAPITALPEGGSGTFTKVDFDLDNNGSIDYTDSTPGDGFVYDLDTTSIVTTGTVTIKMTATDSALATGFVIATYGIDNRCGGRIELVQNGGFEDWSGVYPDKWDRLDVDPNGVVNLNPGNVTIEKETAAPKAGTNALKITFSASDPTYAYTMKSNNFKGNLDDYILWYWGKGGADVKMCYFTSNDGATWVSTWHLVNSDSSALLWNMACDTPYNIGLDPLYMCVVTYKYTATPSYWDEVSVTSSGDCTPPPQAAKVWDIYE